MTIEVLERGQFQGKPAVSILILYPKYADNITTRNSWHQDAIMLAQLIDCIDRRLCVIECDECEEIAICAIKRVFQKHISFQCRGCAMENWKSCRDLKILWTYRDIVQSFNGETDDTDEKIRRAITRLLYAKGIDLQQSLEDRALRFVQKVFV